VVVNHDLTRVIMIRRGDVYSAFASQTHAAAVTIVVGTNVMPLFTVQSYLSPVN